MIRKKHALGELKQAGQVVYDKTKSTDEKIVALYVCLSVITKVVLDVRLNVVRLLEHFKVPLIQPESKESKEIIKEEDTNIGN